MKKILENFMILEDIQEKLLNGVEADYVFIFNYDLVKTTRDPKEILNLLKVCSENSELTEENIDLYISNIENILTVVKNYQVKSWEKVLPLQKMRAEIDFISWKKRRDRKYSEFLKKERVK